MGLRRAGWIIALGAALVHTALAGNECTGPSSDCVAVGSWNFSISLGAGVRTNPLVNGQDIPLVVIPQFSYYGKRFFIEDLDFGVTLLDAERNTVSLIASPGYDRVFFYRSDLQNLFVGNALNVYGATPTAPKELEALTTRPRHVTYLAGPEWTFKYGRIAGQLDALHEVTGQNHGNEIRAALHIPLIEATGSLSANVGLTWKSAAIVNYYYGAPNVYQAGAAVNPFVRVGYLRPLSRRWRLTAFVHLERLGDAIAESPIVAERYVTTLFTGATFVF